MECIELVQLDNKAADKCPDYDEECKDVIDPLRCMAGDENCPPIDGYCPMLFNT